jgi:hypothetical protein
VHPIQWSSTEKINPFRDKFPLPFEALGVHPLRGLGEGFALL